MRNTALPAAVALVCTVLQWAPTPNETPRAAGVPTIEAPLLPPAPAPPIGTPSRYAVDLEAELVADGLGPVVLVTAPDGDDRLFLVEQAGRVLLWEDGTVLAEPFLDLSTVVAAAEVEQGLLGMAFHPGYPDNGRFFVYYTNTSGDSRVVEHRVSGADPNRADPRAVALVLAVPQPHHYHNAGMLQFGPDGMLYVAFGDGGGMGDQFGHARRTDSLLGKIIRVSVDHGRPYRVPIDNPFADAVGGAPEVWFTGLRNPWRFWIDGGLVYIGDVGQGRWEEVDVVPLASPGADFGWSIVEGKECFEAETCDGEGFIEPVLTYPHNTGCAVVGGPVYRGDDIPELEGHFFFGDFCAGWVWSFRYEGAVTDLRDWSGAIGDLGQILSFGVDGHGEIYVTTGGGSVYRLAVDG